MGRLAWMIAMRSRNSKAVRVRATENDRTVTPDAATRLRTAAFEPKDQRWYDSGHLPPNHAYEDAAVWIEKHAARAITAPKVIRTNPQ